MGRHPLLLHAKRPPHWRLRRRRSRPMSRRLAGASWAGPPVSAIWQSFLPRLACCRSLLGTRCAANHMTKQFSPSARRLLLLSPGTVVRRGHKHLDQKNRPPSRARRLGPAWRPSARKPCNKPRPPRCPCSRRQRSRGGEPQRCRAVLPVIRTEIKNCVRRCKLTVLARCQPGHRGRKRGAGRGWPWMRTT
jgi:hypothetical protein